MFQRTLLCPVCGSLNQEFYDLEKDSWNCVFYCKCGAQVKAEDTYQDKEQSNEQS